MGNWKLTRIQEPVALTASALREMRTARPAGLSRRQLIRRSIGAATGLWLLEVTAGSIGSLWPNLARGFGGGAINLGDIDTVSASPEVQGSTLRDGAPSYFPLARTFVQLIDANLAFQDGSSSDGEGTTTNVRTLYQRCPHLGCKPNFCTKNYWFECPCHGSRYDRLGTKVEGLGPAPRSLDRFAHVVQDGDLIADTSRMILGPLPVGAGSTRAHPGQVAHRVHMSDERSGRELTQRLPALPGTSVREAPQLHHSDRGR